MKSLQLFLLVYCIFYSPAFLFLLVSGLLFALPNVMLVFAVSQIIFVVSFVYILIYLWKRTDIVNNEKWLWTLSFIFMNPLGLLLFGLLRVFRKTGNEPQTMTP